MCLPRSDVGKWFLFQTSYVHQSFSLSLKLTPLYITVFTRELQVMVLGQSITSQKSPLGRKLVLCMVQSYLTAESWLQPSLHAGQPDSKARRSSCVHPFTEISVLLPQLLWKLGLWMIWESFPNESITSTLSSICTVPGWSGTSGAAERLSWRVFILGRNRARAGVPRSTPCSLCWLVPKLRGTPCPSEV